MSRTVRRIQSGRVPQYNFLVMSHCQTILSIICQVRKRNKRSDNVRWCDQVSLQKPVETIASHSVQSEGIYTLEFTKLSSRLYSDSSVQARESLFIIEMEIRVSYTSGIHTYMYIERL